MATDECRLFGAFEEAGTFAMHSAYSIDGGPAVDFIPASTNVRPSYRQKFFQVDNLPDGEHTLVITNVGKEFWLDYPWVNQTSQSQDPELPSSSASPSPPPSAATPSPGPTAHPETHRSVTSLGLSSQTKITQSFASTNNAASFTSTKTSALTSAPGIAAPSGTLRRGNSANMAPGAIAGLAAVVGALVVVVVLIRLVGWRRCHQKHVKHGDLALAPGILRMDPGLATLAFGPSEKTTTACAAHAKTSARDHDEEQPSVQQHVHEVQNPGLGEIMTGRHPLRGFEPLGPPSSASPHTAHRESLRRK